MGEVSVIGQATNMKNLHSVLTNLENYGKKTYPDYRVVEAIPEYNELVKIFKDRANTPRIQKTFLWLDGDDPFTLTIAYIADNVSLQF